MNVLCREEVYTLAQELQLKAIDATIHCGTELGLDGNDYSGNEPSAADLNDIDCEADHIADTNGDEFVERIILKCTYEFLAEILYSLKVDKQGYCHWPEEIEHSQLVYFAQKVWTRCQNIMNVDFAFVDDPIGKIVTFADEFLTCMRKRLCNSTIEKEQIISSDAYHEIFESYSEGGIVPASKIIAHSNDHHLSA